MKEEHSSFGANEKGTSTGLLWIAQGIECLLEEKRGEREKRAGLMLEVFLGQY